MESGQAGQLGRKRFVEDARGFYAGEEIPDKEIEQWMRADLADDACVYMASQDDFRWAAGWLVALVRDWLERMVAGYA